jgi:hypothetical protein
MSVRNQQKSFASGTEHFAIINTNSAFITLNNAGVSLLKRGRYLEATSIFRNAILVGKASLDDPTNTAADEVDIINGHGENQIFRILTEANQCLARASMTSENTVLTRTGFCVEEITDHCCPSYVIQNNAHPIQQHELFFAITIDSSMDGFDHDSRAVFDFRSAITLYNYGIACRCYSIEMLLGARKEQSSRRMHAMENKALTALMASHRLAQMSLKILSEQNTSRHELRLYSSLDKLMLLSTLVLQQITETMMCDESSKNSDDDVDDYTECYLNCITFVNTNVNRRHEPSTVNPAAAA